MTPTTGVTVLAADRVLGPDELHSPGWVAVEQDRIVEVGAGVPSYADERLGPVTLVPGFVDLHCHGGGGRSFSDGVEGAREALLTHRRHGTTSVMASLATDTLEAMTTQARTLAPMVEED